MENQDYNPIQEYKEVQLKIQGGDTELAQKWAQGEFRELREKANAFEETPVEIHEEELVTPEVEPEHVESTNEEEVPEEEFDQEAHERKLYDEEMERFNSEVAAAKAEAEEQTAKAEEIRKKNLELLKELDETRKANDTDEDSFFDIEPETVKQVDTYAEVEKVSDTSNNQEIKAELEQLKRQLSEKESWNNTVRDYGDFWSSKSGKELAPDGAGEASMTSFNDFYADLTSGSNSRDALRLMYDIRKNGINDHYKSKLDEIGVKVPSEFEKMYDSMEVAAFAAGKVIDPKRGELVPSGRGSDMSMEDAHYLLNRDAERIKAKKEAYDSMRNKLDQRNNAAIQVSPSNYAPVNTPKQDIRSASYREALIKSAVKEGYDGRDMNRIKDPSIRAQMQELHANIKKQ